MKKAWRGITIILLGFTGLLSLMVFDAPNGLGKFMYALPGLILAAIWVLHGVVSPALKKLYRAGRLPVSPTLRNSKGDTHHGKDT